MTAKYVFYISFVTCQYTFKTSSLVLVFSIGVIVLAWRLHIFGG